MVARTNNKGGVILTSHEEPHSSPRCASFWCGWQGITKDAPHLVEPYLDVARKAIRNNSRT